MLHILEGTFLWKEQEMDKRIFIFGENRTSLEYTSIRDKNSLNMRGRPRNMGDLQHTAVMR